MKTTNTHALRRVATVTGVAFLAATVAGCGGGSSNNNNGTSTTAIDLLGLQNDGLTLVAFNTQTADTVTTQAVTGLLAQERLIAIDTRGSATDVATNGLFGFTNQGRLYRLDAATVGTTTTRTATLIGAPVQFANGQLPPDFGATSGVGFDFNPPADRIRLVSGSFNARLNPVTGTAVDGDSATPGTQTDTPLSYVTGDVGAGQTPNIVAAAYTDNDTDATTTTASVVNFAIDATRGTLVRQGTPETSSGANDAVSPNTGLLTTIGATGLTNFAPEIGFEIVTDGTNETGLAVFTPQVGGASRLYRISLTTGRAAFVRRGEIGGGLPIIGLAVAD